VNCINIGSSKDPFVAHFSNFALIFGNELDAEVNMLSGLLCYVTKQVL
jgi:endoribonuclease Dicer